MDKSRNEFLLNANIGLDQILQWTCDFEYQLNELSFSFMNSLSNVLHCFYFNTKEEWINNIVKDLRSFLAITESDFNSQLTELFDLYHIIKLSYTSHIEQCLEIMNDGIKRALHIIIIQMKQSQNSRQSNSFNNLFFKQKVEIIKKQLTEAHQNVSNCHKQCINELKEKKNRTAEIILSIEKENDEFKKSKSLIETQMSDIQTNIDTQKEEMKKKKVDNDQKIGYYMMLNNIENETVILNRLKNTFHNEIQRLRERNQNDRTKYVDSFKLIHDKICEQMSITNSLYKQLEDLRKKNEADTIETKKNYEQEKKELANTIEVIVKLQKENENEIGQISQDLDLEYIKAKNSWKMTIEMEKHRQEKEFKQFQQKLNEKYHKNIQQIHSFFESTSSLKTLESEYQSVYNKYINELSSPVFSSAIGYQKSGVIEQLKLNKDEVSEKVNNERNQLFHKFYTDLNLYSHSSITKNSVGMRPSSFYQLTNQENKLLKVLNEEQQKSMLEIITRDNEKKKEIRKLRKQLNLVYRIYFTKKLYLIDSFESFDDSKFIAMLTSDEQLEKRIELLEERIQDLMFNVQIKNRSSQRTIKILETRLDQLNSEFNQIYDEYYRYRNSTGAPKHLTKTTPTKLKNIIRSKSNLAPNVISPFKSKPTVKKKS